MSQDWSGMRVGQEALVSRTEERIEQLQQAISNISSVRRRLQQNAQEVKCEISTAFSRQLERMRNREVWLLHQVELIQQAKEDVLRGQQDRLCHLVGSLTTSLDLCDEEPQPGQLTSKLSQSIERLDEIDLRPAETPHMCFRSDAAALAEATKSFGRIDSRGLTLGTAFIDSETTSACLPKSFEDYEDPEHHVLYKTVEDVKKTRNITVTIPKLQKPISQWLSYTPAGGSTASSTPCASEAAFTFVPNETKVSELMSQHASERSLQQWLLDIKQETEGEEDEFELISPGHAPHSVSECCESLEHVALTNDEEPEEAIFDDGYFHQVAGSPKKAWLSTGGMAKDNDGLQEEEMNMMFRLNASLDGLTKWLDRTQVESSDGCCKGSCLAVPNVDIENLDLLLCTQDQDKAGRQEAEKDVDESEDVSQMCRANEPCHSFSECVCDENCGQAGGDEAPTMAGLNPWLQAAHPTPASSKLFSYFQAASKNMGDWLSQSNTQADPLPYNLFPVFQQATQQLEWLLQTQASKQIQAVVQEEANKAAQSIKGILEHMSSIHHSSNSQWLHYTSQGTPAPSRIVQPSSPSQSQWLSPARVQPTNSPTAWKPDTASMHQDKQWLLQSESVHTVNESNTDPESMVTDDHISKWLQQDSSSIEETNTPITYTFPTTKEELKEWLMSSGATNKVENDNKKEVDENSMDMEDDHQWLIRKESATSSPTHEQLSPTKMALAQWLLGSAKV